MSDQVLRVEGEPYSADFIRQDLGDSEIRTTAYGVIEPPIHEANEIIHANVVMGVEATPYVTTQTKTVVYFEVEGRSHKPNDSHERRTQIALTSLRNIVDELNSIENNTFRGGLE